MSTLAVMALSIGVTGASGFIGSALCTAFHRAGWNVVAFCRGNVNFPYGVRTQMFDLRQGAGGDTLRGLDVLIHAAYDASPDAAQTNVSGTRALFDAAANAGVRQRVLISSMAAAGDSASRYGRDKFAAESLLDPSSDLVVRPGLVIGDGGLFRSMYGMLARFRVAPVFSGGRQPVYVVGIDDLCKAMVQLVARHAHGVHVIANETPVPMRDLYLAIGRKTGRRIFFAPLPLDLTLGLVTFFEGKGVRLPLDSERLRGIRNLRLQPVPPQALDGLRLLPLDRILESLCFPV